MDQVKFVEDGLLNTLSHLVKQLKRLLSYSYDSNWFPFQNIVLSQRIGVSQANYFSHYGYTNIIKANYIGFNYLPLFFKRIPISVLNKLFCDVAAHFSKIFYIYLPWRLTQN